MKILLDSSVWIEYFSGGPNSKGIEKYFRASHEIVLPSIVAYEVYKKIKSAKGERMAVLVLAQMERFACAMVSLDQGAAIAAADLTQEYRVFDYLEEAELPGFGTSCGRDTRYAASFKPSDLLKSMRSRMNLVKACDWRLLARNSGRFVLSA